MAAYHSYSHSFASGSGPTQADLFSLSKRAKLKAKYGELQRNYVRALQLRTELTLELAEKEAKIQRLQDEVDLVLDQIYDTDYVHLAPKNDDLFSDSGEDDSEGGDGDGRPPNEDDNEHADGPGANGEGNVAPKERVRKERSYSTADSDSGDRKPKKARLDQSLRVGETSTNGAK